jgi:hypothetical protein
MGQETETRRRCGETPVTSRLRAASQDGYANRRVPVIQPATGNSPRCPDHPCAATLSLFRPTSRAICLYGMRH